MRIINQKFAGILALIICAAAFYFSLATSQIAGSQNPIIMSPLSYERLSSLIYSNIEKGQIGSETEQAASILLERQPRHAMARLVQASSYLAEGQTDLFIYQLGTLNNTDPKVLSTIIPEMLKTITDPRVIDGLRPFMENPSSDFGKLLAETIAQSKPHLFVNEPDILKAHPKALNLALAEFMRQGKRNVAELIFCETLLSRMPCSAGSLDPSLKHVEFTDKIGWQLGPIASVTIDGVEVFTSNESREIALSQIFSLSGAMAPNRFISDIEIAVPGIELSAELICQDLNQLIWTAQLLPGRHEYEIPDSGLPSCSDYQLSIHAQVKQGAPAYGVALLSYSAVEAVVSR